MSYFMTWSVSLAFQAHFAWQLHKFTNKNITLTIQFSSFLPLIQFRMESLEQRLSEIERRVFGHQNPDTLAALCRRRNDVSFVQELTDIAKECGNAVEARGERISPLFRRAPELDKYLDPGFAEEMGGVPTNLKADLILNREQMLKDVHEMLEKVVQRQVRHALLYWMRRSKICNEIGVILRYVFVVNNSCAIVNQIFCYLYICYRM